MSWRQCLPVVLKDSESCCHISAKNAMCIFGFKMTPVQTGDRTVLHTVDCTILQYSRLYYAVIQLDYTRLSRHSSTTCVFDLNLKDECCVVVTSRPSRKTETRPRWRWSLYFIMVHSQVAVLLPVGEARAMHLCILKADGQKNAHTPFKPPCPIK